LGIIACVVGVSFLLLHGCSHPPKIPAGKALPEDKESGLAPSPSVEVHFYLDTTQSIRGFLHQPEGKPNYFSAILTEVGGVLSGTWAKYDPHYWGFGRKGDPWPIEVRDYLDPKKFDGTRTFINEPIAHRPPVAAGRPVLPRVKVILTDLYQDKNDMDMLATNMAAILDDPTQAIGILGIRNPFQGVIDDLPGGEKLPDGSADSLPFYLIFIGPAGDVTKSLNEFATKMKMDKLPPDQSFSMIFGRRAVTGGQRRLEMPQVQGLVRKDDKVTDAERLGIPYLADVRRDESFDVTNGCRDPQLTQISSRLKVSPDPVISVYQYVVPSSKKDRDKMPDGADWVVRPENYAAKTTGLKSDPSDCMKGSISIDRSRLEKNAVYLFQIELTAERADFASLKDWYVKNEDIPAIVRDGAFDQKIGKTPNLQHLLQTLSNKMVGNRMSLAKYYFYVETR
jgi:hypothetical protein